MSLKQEYEDFFATPIDPPPVQAATPTNIDQDNPIEETKKQEKVAEKSNFVSLDDV